MSKLPWVVEYESKSGEWRVIAHCEWQDDGAHVLNALRSYDRRTGVAYRVRDTRLDVPTAPLDCAPDAPPTPHMDRVMTEVAARTKRVTEPKPLDANAVRAIVREELATYDAGLTLVARFQHVHRRIDKIEAYIAPLGFDPHGGES